MSLHLYISLSPPVPGLDPNRRDRTLMAMRLPDKLDARAAELGVRPLSAFVSYDPDDLLAQLDPDDFGPDLTPEQVRAANPLRHFDPAPAIATLDALLRYCREQPTMLPYDGLKTPAQQAAFVAELEDCREILSAASAAGSQFRFHVGE